MILKNGNTNSGLMKKLVLNFFIIIVVMLFINIYSIYGFKMFYRNFSNMFNQLAGTHMISLRVDELFTGIDNYAHSGNTQYLDEYNTNYLKLLRSITDLRRQGGDVYYNKYTDIYNMVVSFNEKGNNVINVYESGKQQIYINQSVAELHRIKVYIHDENKELLYRQLSESQSYYTDFIYEVMKGEKLISVLTVLVTLLCLVFSYRFSKKISDPVRLLVQRSKRVANGDLDVEDINLNTHDEIKALTDSFNYMTKRIKSLIYEIKEKADVEKKLKEQEIRNLEMSVLLNKSEIKHLQSQINPHFLYNTMNSISSLAEIEEAYETRRMLDSLVNMLRYSLKSADVEVTLREEYETVSNYLYIQRIRFGNRMVFEIDIDERVLDYKIPSMILQPLVENAIIHGLEPKEGIGILKLSIKNINGYVQIVVEDNGAGMSPEKLDSIKNYSNTRNPEDGKGIGLSSVIRRLELIYNRNIVVVDSKPGAGTAITILLPIK